MIPRNCWPNTDQQLLLNAILLPDDAAAYFAWESYIQKINIQDISPDSAAFLPLVYRRFYQSHAAALQVSKSMYRHTWSDNQWKFSRLKKILLLLQAENIPVCLLKGVAMVAHSYRDAGLRLMGDVDLLVPRSQVKKTIHLLLLQGFTLNDHIDDIECLLSRVHAVFLTSPEGIPFDLHWYILVGSMIDQKLARYTYQLHQVYWPGSTAEITVLGAEDQLLHTIFHGLQYNTYPTIRWIVDAVFILKKTTCFNWDYFFSQSRSLNIEIILYCAIHYLHGHCFFDFPSAVIDTINDYSPSRQERRYYKLMTEKPVRFLNIFQWVWHWHRRSATSENTLRLIISLPGFLKKYWRLKNGRQLFSHVIKKVGFHFNRNFIRSAQ